MAVFSCDPRFFWCSHATTGGGMSFRPTGKSVNAGPTRRNPYGYRPDAKQLAARMFINFRTARKNHDLSTIVRVVGEARAKQKKPKSHTSFIVQAGTYTTYTTRRSADTAGAQVLLFGAPGGSLPTFKKQIVTIGEAIVHELRLRVLVVELQRSGLQIAIGQVTP
jgi:hypothetical protein